MNERLVHRTPRQSRRTEDVRRSDDDEDNQGLLGAPPPGTSVSCIRETERAQLVDVLTQDARRKTQDRFLGIAIHKGRLFCLVSTSFGFGRAAIVSSKGVAGKWHLTSTALICLVAWLTPVFFLEEITPGPCFSSIFLRHRRCDINKRAKCKAVKSTCES